VSTHFVAPLSLTQKSNFHILADEKGDFASAQINTAPIEWSMYDGASALGTLFEVNHKTLWFAPNF
jgi:hypothetical protein